MQVDVSPVYPILNVGVQAVLAAAVTFLGGWATWAFHKYAAPYVGAQLDAKASDAINTALKNGTAIAMQKIAGAEKLHDSVEIKNAVVGAAVDYAVEHVPQSVDRFGLTADQLANKALAYLPVPPPNPLR